jgi:hypothetical protein
MQAAMSIFAMLRRWARVLGPYLILEIVLPGGTLLALLLFLYRSRSPALSPVFATLAFWRTRRTGGA